jgi:bacillithiol biosynthesis cysteine-adding enzyme BshC
MKILDADVVAASASARMLADGDPRLSSRFAAMSVTAELCQRRALQGASRSRLVELVEDSMVPNHLSDAQRVALDVLRDKSSVVVATGQQIGMIGGPMYTLYKIRTAVAEARRISSMLGVACTALFWLEDNDHDAAEATALTLPGPDALPAPASVWTADDRRMPVSLRLCDTHMHEQVAAAAAHLTGAHAQETIARITTAWSAGTPWGDAFLTTLAPYLQRWGVLVVRASEVIRSGMHQPLVLMETETSAITTALAEGTAACEHAGIGVQATVPEFGFFVLDNHERRRPQRNESGLDERARTSPQDFSPSVLTRPVVQDALFPTVVNVLGGAELSYHAQLAEAYRACGIEQPVPILRHGATLITPKVRRLISKSEAPVEYYLCRWSDIERKLAAELTHEMLPERAERDATIEALIAPYRSAAEETDVTLIPTVEAQRSGITAALEALEGKIRAAAKRRHAAVVDRARTVHASLMPADTLQERVYPLALWEAHVGIEGMITALEVFDAVACGRHVVIDLEPSHASS